MVIYRKQENFLVCAQNPECLADEHIYFTTNHSTYHPLSSLLLSHFLNRFRRLFGEALGVEQLDQASSSLDGVISMTGGFRDFSLTPVASFSLLPPESGVL